MLGSDFCFVVVSTQTVFRSYRYVSFPLTRRRERRRSFEVRTAESTNLRPRSHGRTYSRCTTLWRMVYSHRDAQMLHESVCRQSHYVSAWTSIWVRVCVPKLTLSVFGDMRLRAPAPTRTWNWVSMQLLHPNTYELDCLSWNAWNTYPSHAGKYGTLHRWMLTYARVNEPLKRY